MNAPERITKPLLADVQDSLDAREIAIQRVGVKSVRHPLAIRRADGSSLATVAMWNLDVELAADKKGTHMSRFIALLEQPREALDPAGLRFMLGKLIDLLGAERGQIELEFPYFVEKVAPVSGVTSLLDYQVRLTGRIDRGETALQMRVVVPVTSLCPCSKEISEYGAHNQRSHVTLEVDLVADLGIEDLVAIAEQEASSELYGLLKRADEKFVTERAFDNPKFVEDLVRDVVKRLRTDKRVGHFAVEVENFESIHNHSAYARVEGRGAGAGGGA